MRRGAEGASARASYGVLNLCHHASHEHPEELVPGRLYRARIELDEVGYRFPAGHRLRLAISTAYWPLIWPSPAKATVTLHLGDCRLLPPVRHAPADDPEPRFDPPEAAPALEEIEHRPASNRRVTTIRRRDRHPAPGDRGRFRGVRDRRARPRHRQRRPGMVRDPSRRPALGADAHPLDRDVPRGDWAVRTESFAELWADAHHFHLTARVEAYEGEELVFQKDWSTSHRRVCV